MRLMLDRNKGKISKGNGNNRNNKIHWIRISLVFQLKKIKRIPTNNHHSLAFRWLIVPLT